MKLKKLDMCDITMITNSIELNIEVWGSWVIHKEWPPGWNKKRSKKMLKQLETLLERTVGTSPMMLSLSELSRLFQRETAQNWCNLNFSSHKFHPISILPLYTHHHAVLRQHWKGYFPDRADYHHLLRTPSSEHVQYPH